MIHLLSKETVEQIAAGEVVERPMSVVKELVENAIDAHASAISVELENGGIDLIRVTDNGTGIAREEIPKAFLNHATSKISSIEDVSSVKSLGFRGEALPSIASVSEIELVTKQKNDPIGTLYTLKANEFLKQEEIGAPDGTTIFVRNLFFNTPARRKFLKTPLTEAGYVSDLFEKIALSHPEIRMKLTVNRRDAFSTPGNGSILDTVYSVFGRETAKETLSVSSDGNIKIEGLIGKPVLSKGNRSFEIYFVNGRFIKNRIVEKAIEDAYQTYMMQHRFPFTVLFLTLPENDFDVNVHPSKMEIRFLREGEVYDAVFSAVRNTLRETELIRTGSIGKEEKEEKAIYKAPEPFEEKRASETQVQKPGANPPFSYERADVIKTPQSEIRESGNFDPGESIAEPEKLPASCDPASSAPESENRGPAANASPSEKNEPEKTAGERPEAEHHETGFRQESFFDRIKEKQYRLIGQLFKTYWLIEMDEALYLMDQHAAHEKVLYERTMASYREKRITTQYLSVPLTVTLSKAESVLLSEYGSVFSSFGFEIEEFGGREYLIRGVPSNLYGIESEEIFHEILEGLCGEVNEKTPPEAVVERVATMSCKAAVKGNTLLTEREAEALLDEMLTLENPYACPHGRPTLIKLTKTEIEKKFKRIV